MTTTLNAATAGAGGLISTADASGVLQLQTAGTAALTIDGSQNVTLAGNITLNNGAADGAQVTLSSSGYSDWNIDNYSGSFRLYNGATERLRLDASGNLGLGVTPSAWGSPFKALQIGTTGNFFASNGGNTSVTYNAYYNGTNYIYQTSDYATRYSTSSSGHLWFTSASGTAGNAISFTQAMTLDASGNLLLNTTTASGAGAKMKIETGVGARTGKFLDLTATGGENWIIDSTNTVSSTDVLGIYAYGATGMYLTDTGNVGIGTTSADTRIKVEGTTAATQAISINAGGNAPTQLSMSNGFANRQGVVFANNGSTGYTSFGMISENTALTFKTAAYSIGTTSDLTTGWTERMRIDGSGYLFVNTTTKVGIGGANRANFYDASNNVVSSLAGASGAAAFQGSVASTSGYLAYWAYYNGSTYTNTGSITTNGTVTAYNVSSDYRLKENITPLTGALVKIASLKPSVYNYKADPATQIEGFIAHELQEVVPHAVTGEKDAVDSEGNPVYQGVDASFLIPHLVASIQEMKTIIDQQAERIAALENK